MVNYPSLSFSASDAEILRARLKDRSQLTLNGCCEINGTLSHGYGLICFKGKIHRTHRVAYAVHKGPIPEGMCVMHSCDNRCCVNPEHLSLGTQKDNLQDCIRKHRAYFQTNPEGLRISGYLGAARRVYVKKPKRARGPHFHKVTDAQVELIRGLRHAGYSLRDLSAQFNIAQSTVSSLCNYRHRVSPLRFAANF